MERILEEGSRIVVRFDPDEEVVQELVGFLEDRRGGAEPAIGAGLISAIGSAKEVELGFYDVLSKEYKKRTFREALEVVNLTGNIGVFDGSPAVHMHGIFCGAGYGAIGGHVHRLVVNTTVEMLIESMSGELSRSYDENTGLNLLSPS